MRAGGFEVDPPPGFELHAALTAVAIAPADDDLGPRASLALNVEAAGGDLTGEVTSALEAQLAALAGARLLDRRSVELAGGPGVRTLLTHDLGGVPMVVEQWWLLDHGAVCTVTAARRAVLDLELAEPLAAAAATVRRVDAAPEPQPPLRFDPRTATVVAAPGQLEALVELAMGREADVAAAAAAGAVVDGEPHVTLAPGLLAIMDPDCRLALERHGERAEAWLRGGAAALRRPVETGREQLTVLPAAFVPAVVAALVELAPRPAGERAPLRLPAGELALALARGDGTVPPARGMVAHWRLTAEWAGREPRVVEVLDGACGLWFVEASGAEIDVRPAAAAEVFGALEALLQSS